LEHPAALYARRVSRRLPDGNPPSGVASGYVWFDVMALLVAPYLVALTADLVARPMSCAPRRSLVEGHHGPHREQRSALKFLLTSAGIKNPSINDAMLELLGKPIAECDALCIPTASYGHAPGGIRGAYRFITGQATTPMCELAWKSVGVLELTALPTLDRELWVPLVEETDVLLANGGDSLYLAHHMRESGLAGLLSSLSAVWVGLSAGSMVMTPRIGEDFKVWNPPDGGDAALGIVDFSIFPHVDHPMLPENTMAAAERWAAGLSGPAYAIDDETAIKVVDGTVEVVSEGHWKLFASQTEA
jgi:dipeptidase E